MRHLLTLIFLLAGITAAADMIRDIEDRAAEGDPAAIIALRDSAECGNTRAMNFLGFLYWQGMGTRLDTDSALFYLRRASDLGDAKASANLGHLLLTGAPALCPDTAEAIRLLDHAAGMRSSAALRELADYFDNNPGDSASAPAIKKVADAYSLGFILPYNYRKAIRFYERSAALGDTTSKHIISELLEFFPDALE